MVLLLICGLGALATLFGFAAFVVGGGMSDGWQPIETAPKDERILLWVKGHLVMLGGWNGLSMYGGPSWWANNSPIIPQPTHWAPLLEPPGDQ